MIPVPKELEVILATFSPLFTRPTWPHARTLLIGAILTLSQRTVCAALRAVGLAGTPRFVNYHRVLNRARWSALAASRVLLGLLVDLVSPEDPLVLLLDETLERRKGKRIQAKGWFRDPVRSNQGKTVSTLGLRWICMTLVVAVPWARRPWALPFLSVLLPSEGTCKKHGWRHRTVTQRAYQMVCRVLRWHPHRLLVVVADGAYAGVEFIHKIQALSGRVTLVTRIRWNAALFDPPPPRVPGRRGRPPLKGKRQPSLAERARDPKAPWTRLCARWNNGSLKTVQVLWGRSLWYTKGHKPVPVLWVIVRDPTGKLEDLPLVCSNLDASIPQIVQWYARRWNTEVTFQECRAHLGFETQRQWSQKAIDRTTPCVLGLYSIVTLAALRLVSSGRMPAAQAAWYRKHEATFSDVLALVRRAIWTCRYFGDSSAPKESTQIPRSLVRELIQYLAYGT